MNLMKFEEEEEIMPHNLLHLSPLRRTLNAAMVMPLLAEERDDITRQRLLFTALLREHYEPLFNASGGPEDRATKWEEARQLMIEQGAQTLLDKDWKYVSGCYWQNIRKESIRRIAKLKSGVNVKLRPAQVELDRAVTEIINRRGPNTLETVLQTYCRAWTEDGGEHGEDAEGHHDPDDGGGGGEQQHRQQRPRRRTAHNSDIITLGEEIDVEDHPLSNSASPAIVHDEPQLVLSSHQATLAQLVHNATSHCSSSASSSTSVPPPPAAVVKQPISVAEQQSTSSGGNTVPGSQFSSISTKANGSKQHHNFQQQHIHVAVVDEAATSTTNLGKLVTKTHALLLNGGFEGMAGEFEQQIKQLVTGYKAWMFDQLFQQDEAEMMTKMEGHINGGVPMPSGTSGRMMGPAKRAKFE